jgi:hypothetical protein
MKHHGIFESKHILLQLVLSVSFSLVSVYAYPSVLGTDFTMVRRSASMWIVNLKKKT